MNKAIENRLKELQFLLECNIDDIKFVTEKEFERDGVHKSKHAYLTYINNIKIIDLRMMLNFYYYTLQ